MKQQKLEKRRLLNLIIHFNSKASDMSIMKLDKLVYLYDQEVFKRSGASATGLTYYTEENGPAPKLLNTAILANDSEYFLNEMSFEAGSNSDYKVPLVIHSNKIFDDLYFSDFQMDVLNEVTEKYIHLSAQELSGLTHMSETPYSLTVKKSGLDKPIDLCLALGSTEKDKLIKEFAKEELGYSVE
jgi:uncharacterized phage-associated protein